MPTKARTKSPLQGVEWPTEPFFRANLPLPPGLNASYEVGSPHGKAQFFSSPELKAWKQEVSDIITYQVWRDINNNDIFNKIHKTEGLGQKMLYTLEMDFYFKTLFKQDEDMGIKAMQDAVFNALGFNDNRVKRLEVEKFDDRVYQRCEIRLSVYRKKG